MKTVQTKASVSKFIASTEDKRKRDDCRAITKLMAEATGAVPEMWGTSIVGFGTHHYLYANGKPGKICKVGFSPRARSFSFYLPRYPEHASLIEKLGKHKYSGGCLQVTRLSDVDSEILALMVRFAFRTGDGSC
jgi:hypothetical protein